MKKNTLIKVILTLLIIYVVILLIACLAQTSLIFHPQKINNQYRYTDPYGNAEEIFLNTSDHEKINGLFFTAKSDKVILYFHGNAGSLAGWQGIYEDFHLYGYNFLIIDYRGYGKSTGGISEKGLYEDGKAALEFLEKKGFKKENIILYGRSIGSGIAAEMAYQMDTVSALILETPFISMPTLANEKMPFLLPGLILRYRFHNKEKIKDLRIPLLVIHGTKDQLIPYAHGKAIFDQHTHYKEMITVENGTHNDLSDFPEFNQGIIAFLNYLERHKNSNP